MMLKRMRNLRVFLVLMAVSVPGVVLASGPAFNDTTQRPVVPDANGNVGVGTTTPQGGFVVTNGNVGIGTWAPVQLLDVKGTTRVANFIMSGQSPSNGFVLSATDSLGDTTWIPSTVGGGWTVVGSNTYLTTPSNNVGVGTTTPQGAFVVTNGNVGIGTWAPTGALQVGTNTLFVNTSAGNVGIGATGTSGGKLVISNNENGWGLAGQDAQNSNVQLYGFYNDGGTGQLQLMDSTATAKINFQARSGQSNFINNGGNVGLGTTTPQTALAVTNGNVGIGTWTAVGGNLIINGGGNVGIGSAWPGVALDVNGRTRTTNFTMTGQSPSPGYVLTASNSSGDATWTVTTGVGNWTKTGNDIYNSNSGNVGIGTTVPGTALDVKSSGNTIARSQTSSTGNYGGLQAQADTANLFGFGLGSTYGGTSFAGLSGNNQVGIEAQSASSFYIGTSVAAPIVFAQGRVERARMDTNGNVGIGSTVPQSKLDVNGQVQINMANPGVNGLAVTATTGTNAAGILLNNTGGNMYVAEDKSDGSLFGAGAYTGAVWMPSNQALTFGTNNLARMTITNGGNVGIGTTVFNSISVIGSVTPKLTIANATTPYMNVDFTTNTSYGGLIITQGEANGGIVHLIGSNFATANRQNNLEIEDQSAGAIAFFTGTSAGSATEKVRIDNTGNVGIGTTIPATTLSIGASTVASTGGRVAIKQTGAADGFVSQASSNDDYVSLSHNGTVGQIDVNFQSSGGYVPLTFRTNGSERVRIDTNGNVGIGSTLPLTKLQVGSGFTFAGGDVPSAGAGTITANINNTNATTNGDSGYQLTLTETSALGSTKGGAIGFQAVYDGSNNIATIAGIKGLRANATSGDFSGYLQFLTRGSAGSTTERMRIDSAGNVGIGTVNPTTFLEVETNQNAVTTARVTNTNGSGGATARFQAWNGTDEARYEVLGTGYTASGVLQPHYAFLYGGIGLSVATAGPILFAPGGTTEKMRLDSNGNVGIGTTNPGVVLDVASNMRVNGAGQKTGIIEVTFINNSSLPNGINITSLASGASTAIGFYNPTGGATAVGTIVTTNSATAYNTSSDRRLKENIIPTTAGLETLLQVPVDDFNFISDPKKMRLQGFIAQDLYKYYPEAVSVGGDIKHPWQVDYGRVTPLIVAGVQELNKQVQELAKENKALKARVEQLERLLRRPAFGGTPRNDAGARGSQ